MELIETLKKCLNSITKDNQYQTTNSPPPPMSLGVKTPQLTYIMHMS